MSTSENEFSEQWFEQRDPEAFRHIVLHHAGTVYGVCQRILGDSTAAEDVSQECFEALASAPQSPRTSSIGAWLHGVATKRSLQYIRSDSRRRQRESRFATRQAVHTAIEWNDIYDYVDEAIAELPEKLRAPLVMHFLEGVTIYLSKETGFVGHVRDAAGNPLEGVSVNTFKRSYNEQPDALSTTDSEGFFSLDGVAPGSVVNLLTQRPGYAIRIDKDTEVLARGTTKIELELRPEARITGVVAADSEPVPDLMLHASTSDCGYSFIQFSKTDDKGHFDLTGLPEGEYRLWAKQQEPPRLKWTATVNVAEGETREVNLDEPDDPAGTATLIGVLSAPGSSPSDYVISVAPLDGGNYGITKGPGSGTFIFDYVPPGKYTVAVLPFRDGLEDARITTEVLLEANETTQIELIVE